MKSRLMDSDGRESLVLGVTGGIACGKSEVGKILERKGFQVLDADDVARKVVERGEVAYDGVVERFGNAVLGRDGEIDRPTLAKMVFEDGRALEDLNRMVHPPVCRKCREWVKSKKGEKEKLAVIMPLLFEVGETELWDAVVCISCNESTMLKRLERRGLNRSEAEARIAAQMPIAEKKRRSDYVIRNDGDIRELQRATCEMIENISKKQEGVEHDRRY